MHNSGVDPIFPVVRSGSPRAGPAHLSGVVIVKNACRQRGEGKLGFFIALTLFAAGVFLAVKIVPVRITGYQFREMIREEVRYANSTPNSAALRDRIIEKANGLAVPLKNEDLTIRRTESKITIKVAYQQPVDLKLTTYTYRFEMEESAPIF